MRSRRQALASLSAGIVVFAFFVVGVAGAGEAQQQNTRKRDKAQQREAEAISAAIGAVQSGQPAPADLPVAIERTDFFKSADGQTYVAFTATVDGKTMATPALTLMLRVMGKSPAVAAGADKRPTGASSSDKPDAGADGRADARGSAGSAVAYEDLDFTSLLPGEPGQPSRLSRAFQVPAGDYDVYLGLKERNTGDKKQKPKMTVFKQPLSVPDYRGSDLAASSVVVASRIAQLQKPLGIDEQRANPYTIGLLQIVPRGGTEFAKTDELNVYYQIYNEGLDQGGKPNVQIDYTFYRRQADAEKKIAASAPNPLNAATLPQFDASKHQLADSPMWPLATLQPGSYRLELKITDKISGRTITKDVIFSVL